MAPVNKKRTLTVRAAASSRDGNYNIFPLKIDAVTLPHLSRALFKELNVRDTTRQNMLTLYDKLSILFNHRQSEQELLHIQAENRDVVSHTDVRWLSRGFAPQRFFSLREEIGRFLAERGQTMQELSDTVRPQI